MIAGVPAWNTGLMQRLRSADIVERDAVIRTLIDLAQRDSRGPWRTILVAAFLPMLVRIRSRLHVDERDDRDLDQVVMLQFLEAVASYPLADRDPRTAMYLRQDTRRAVVRHLRRDARRTRALDVLAAIAERRCGFDPVRESASGEEPNPFDEQELRELLGAHLCDRLDGASRELVEKTTLGGVPLWRYVEAKHPGLAPAERQRVYNRLKRRRERAIKRIATSIRAARERRGGVAA